MDIYFIKSGYNSYGGGFKAPFTHLGRIISDRFEAEKIEFSFQEIEIQLAIFSNKPKGNNKEVYTNWFNKLPVYYRGKSMVRVTLPIFKNEEDLNDIFKWIHEVFEIIARKKKKDDVLNVERMKEVLILLETELNKTDLWELNKKYESILRQETIAKRLKERTERQNRVIENKRLIYDLRFYYRFENIDKLYFTPYDHRLCNKILEKLRERKFRLPDYTHIYLSISNSFENALYEAVRVETWFAYGVAVLENYTDYENKNEKEKQRIVFDLLKQGLHDIANIDKLDMDVLNEVLNEVEQGLMK
ncbi:hypothetical protein J0383_20805 [Flavobacterium endoglycinae]|uniref:Uncharacterized protein n=1 Tax=Flavobacterium endoglycinae TaxID=2816357 RepID=A0ABX7QDJ4_9FLAO|nr:hypothetical protein [Flavobacterium endoglycinae]QSW88668.1 hypothetical protein J0383_20805 [Flavobacterium endoglycinae]